MSNFSEFLKSRGEGAKKSLSQNFLINPKIIEKVVEAGHFVPGDAVLEVGPGGGALTAPILEKGAELTAVEISPLMTEWLEQFLGSKLRLIHEDVLRVNFKELYPSTKGITLVSSVPYNITSPLFEHLFASSSLFKRYIVIVQKEVGEVLLAEPGTANYGILSILTQRFTRPKKLLTIVKGNFRPMPKVDSMALVLEARNDVSEEDAKPFLFFLKQLFSLRRKTLEHAFKILGFPPVEEKRRAEKLTADELYDLFKKQ